MEQTSSEIELVFNGVQSLRTFVPTFLAASGAVAQDAGAAGLGAAGFAPLLGGMGLAAVGGMGLMAMNECSAPLCIATSGQCCLLGIDSRGVVCPLSC